jgi:excisionase family DNA binding protein
VLLKEAQIEPTWVDYPTAERFSGLSHVTLWRRIKAGEIKAARVGRSVRIHLPSLQQFMEAASEEVVGK